MKNQKSIKKYRALAVLTAALTVGAANAAGPFEGIYLSQNPATPNMYFTIHQETLKTGENHVFASIFRIIFNPSPADLSIVIANQYRPPAFNYWELYGGNVAVSSPSTVLVTGRSDLEFCDTSYFLSLTSSGISYEMYSSTQNPDPAVKAQNYPCALVPGKFQAKRLP